MKRNDSITVDVTNIGKDYEFIGSTVDLFGSAKLYLRSDENQVLNTLPFANSSDATTRVFKKGETAQYTYYFYTDENSPEGSYTLTVPFGGEYKVFESVLRVKAPPTEEELAMIELANTVISKEYPAISLGDLSAEASQNTDGEYSVKYTLTIGGYRTWESYHVRFNADKTVKSFYANYESKYSAYLPYATDEKIREAEEKLTKQVEQYDNPSGFYLSIDDDGYLTLAVEVIIKLDGISNKGGGCGIDHEHKFFSERICGLQ